MPHIWFVVSLLLLLPSISHATPTDNELKFWLGTQKVVVKKRRGPLPDQSELMERGSLRKLKVVDEKRSVNKMYSLTALNLTFEYLPERNDSPLICNASIAYSWTTVKLNAGKNTLETITAKCL